MDKDGGRKKKRVAGEVRWGRNERTLEGQEWAWKCLENLLGGALGHGHRQDKLWGVRGDRSKKELWRKLVGPLDIWGTLRTVVLEGPLTGSLVSDGPASRELRGACGYLHDADIIRAVQLTLLDHLLLESGQAPLQVLPLTGVLLLQVRVQPCDLHLMGQEGLTVREGRAWRAGEGGKGGRAHHVCPLHVLLKESADLLLQLPGFLEVRHAVVKVRLKPFDQRLQVPLLQAEAFTSGPIGILQGQGLQPCGCLKGQETPHLGLTVDHQGPHRAQRPGWAHSPEGEALKLLCPWPEQLHF